MNIVAELTLASESLPLVAVVEQSPVSRVEFDAVVPTGRHRLQFVRLWTDAGERVLTSLLDDPAVASARPVSTVEGALLCRVRWADGRLEWLVEAVEAATVALLGVTVDADGWRLRVSAFDEDDLVSFRRDCRTAVGGAEVTNLTTAARDAGGDEGVTPAQREALVLAAARGYFDRPREVTLADLAAELDISRQAFAGRLRRGQRNLIRATFGGV
ncbi:MAG: helix-turn-helix domain-containing protein [Haloarculaceae archaeon]